MKSLKAKTIQSQCFVLRHQSFKWAQRLPKFLSSTFIRPSQRDESGVLQSYYHFYFAEVKTIAELNQQKQTIETQSINRSQTTSKSHYINSKERRILVLILHHQTTLEDTTGYISSTRSLPKRLI